MTPRKTKTYALIGDKKNRNLPAYFSEMSVDEIIQGQQVTKDILSKLKAKDTLVVANIASLGKSISDIVETLNVVADYKINLCLAQENLSFKADKLPEVASSLLIALRLQQSLISLRSKTALSERKAKGIKLGRPYGANPALKLDDHKEEIKKLLLTGVSKDKIAEKFNVCRATVYNFVRKNPELLSGEVL